LENIIRRRLFTVLAEIAKSNEIEVKEKVDYLKEIIDLLEYFWAEPDDFYPIDDDDIYGSKFSINEYADIWGLSVEEIASDLGIDVNDVTTDDIDDAAGRYF